MVAMLQLGVTAHSACERFEQARELWTRLAPGRRRVGRSVQGFRTALGRVPCRVFRAIAPVLRQRVARVLERVWWVAGWIPFGVDGTHLLLPRQADLERHLGHSGTSGGPPQLWLTAVVHLATGVLWTWCVGPADASERDHMRALITTMPQRSLLVADAGFISYQLWQALASAGRHFLIRLRSGVRVYADFEMEPRFQEGLVYFWPQTYPRPEPMRLRLIRLPGRHPDGAPVWLATNVLESTQLSPKMASEFYRQRWEQELFFRAYKCTLQQAKLSSRSGVQVIREVELALLSTQLLLAQAAWAVQRTGQTRRASVAEAMRQVRREYRDLLEGHLRTGYLKRLGKAVREDRPGRTSSKDHRRWPRKTEHKPPGPPNIITLTVNLKQRIERQLGVA